MESTLKAKYEIWMEKAVADPDLKPELEAMAGDEAKIEDAFYKDLEFGTAGLRGVIGAGTNRMNVYIVARVIKDPAEVYKHTEELLAGY